MPVPARSVWINETNTGRLTARRVLSAHAPMSEERMTESVCSLAVPKPNQGLPMKLKKKILETQ